jgi:putative N6-adenine-specific DNA methylase
MVALARRNLEEAGMGGAASLQTCDVLAVTAPAPAGVVVINPPYGLRLGDAAALRELYPELGNLLKQRFAGWRVGIFSADTELPRSVRLKTSRRTPLFNGAIECRLYEYRMVEGSARVRPAGERA